LKNNLKNKKMNTPILDEKIKSLQDALDNGLVYPSTKLLYANELEEYKAIKSFIETHSNKENSKRYFIVSFSGFNDIGNVTGFIDFSTDGGFLNLKTTIEFIKEKQGIKECVITNIIEVSEQDFNDWNYKP